MAARRRGRSSVAACKSELISAVEYRYGVARHTPLRTSPAGGPVRSTACRYAAKPRTTLSRSARQRDDASAGSAAQAKAYCVVTVLDAAGFEVVDELAEQPSGVLELEPQSPTQAQIFV